MPIITWARLSLVLIVSLVLQVSLFNQIVVFGAHPDVMVLLPAAAGLVAGAERGAIVGFAAGLLADLVVSLPYGLSPLSFVIAGFGSGLLVSVPIGRDLPGAETFTCAALGAATVVLYVLIGALIGQQGLLGASTVPALIVTALGGIVLAYPVLRSLRWCFGGEWRGSAFSVPSGGSALG